MLASFSLTGRRLLAALLLAGCGVVLGQAPALACTCASGHTQTHTKAANDVFTGKVAAAAPTRTDGRRTMTYDVDVERVYKGDIGTATVQVSSDRSAKTCGLGDLATKRRYLFFATADGAQLTTDSCSGTTRATAASVHKVERLLGNGRPAVPPAPQKAVFTRVADTTTPSLPRLAAPGAAMVLVGLLGLVVVRRLGRRS